MSNGRRTNRWTFAIALAGLALSWLPGALDPDSPGGGDIESEEIYDLVARLLLLLGVTADPTDLQERLKGLF